MAACEYKTLDVWLLFDSALNLDFSLTEILMPWSLEGLLSCWLWRFVSMPVCLWTLDDVRNVSESEFMQALKEFGYESRDRLIFQASHGRTSHQLSPAVFASLIQEFLCHAQQLLG
jgi:hypothetical protein